jgi:hypothetical protein
MPALQEDTPCTDMSGNGFRLQKRDDFYYVIGEKPLCLTHRRDKLHAAGITRFVLDFSLCPAQHKTLATVLQHYADKKRVPGSITGNHKAGLH